MYKYILLILIFGGLVGCDFDDQIDPNNPSAVGILENANVAQLNNLVIGSLSQMRPEMNNYYDVTGVIGREIYRVSGSDPRWISDLLGGSLDNNAFYTTRVWGDRYQTIKNCNQLIEAAMNSTFISISELDGYLGFAKTIMANELIIMLQQRYEQVRIDVVDPDNLGPLVSQTEGWAHAATLLNEAKGHMANAEFLFALHTGFSQNISVSLLTYNRALLARVEINLGNWTSALTAADESFADPLASMTSGAYYSYSSNTGDQLNTVFLPLNNAGENRLAHPSYLEDIRANDSRSNKVALRSDDPGPVVEDGLTGTHDVALYASNTSSIALIKNEELMLIKAEAHINLGQFTEAITFLNAVRNSYGLGDYSGASDASSLMDELIYQRRYSLYYEGHRWNDLIRWSRTSDLPLDRAGDLTHTSFPVPLDDTKID